MGVYVIVGGSNGMGKETTTLLRAQGHTVCVIDYEAGPEEIFCDIGDPDSRQAAIARVHALYPQGIDGLCCIAGVSFPRGKNSSMTSINYFGSVGLADGLFDLLEKRQGSCVLVGTGALAWADKGLALPDIANVILNCEDEERIAQLVDSFPPDSPVNLYVSTKAALTQWARRVSADWALRGVRINVVCPGCIDTRLGRWVPEGVTPNESFHKTIPQLYRTDRLIPPVQLGEIFSFLLQDKSGAFSGTVFYPDAGQEAFFHPDKYYY